jgi:ParB/RepB/Spo0J family partition protein
MPTATEARPQLINIDEVIPNPNQPRRSIDETSESFVELRNSIWRHGLIQPIVVTQNGRSVYTLLAGERRWRVFREFVKHDAARFSRIPAVVRLTAPEPEVDHLVIGLTENVVREDLRPGDRAAAVDRLRELTGMTLDHVAETMGVSLSFVKKLAAISKSEAVSAAVNDRLVSPAVGAVVAKAAGGDEAVARELLGLAKTQPELPLEQVAKAVASTSSSHSPKERVAKAVTTVAYPEAETIALRTTPLAAVKPRLTAMPLPEYEALVRRAAREMRKAKS